MKTQIQKRNDLAIEMEKAANEGHYLERLENMARVLNDRESIMAIGALKQIYDYCGHKPQGTDGIQLEISIRILIQCENLKFTKLQMSKLWYGVHWDSRSLFDLKFPYENNGTNAQKSNTTWSAQ